MQQKHLKNEEKTLKLPKNESKVNHILLYRLAREYHEQAVVILRSNKNMTCSIGLQNTDMTLFYQLINQSIKLYIIILDAHNEGNNKNFFLSVKREISISLKLIDLLLNYTTNHKLAHTLAYKLLIKLSNMKQNDISDDVYKLQFYHTYLIPMSIYSEDEIIKTKSLSNLDILLQKKYDVNNDWLTCFHLCKVNYFFKMTTTDVDLSESFSYFDEIAHYLRTEFSDMFFYIKLCEINYYLSKNEFSKVNLIFDSVSFENYANNLLLKVSFYVSKLYIHLVEEKSIISPLKEISKILTSNKDLFVSNFTLNLKFKNLCVQCTLLQYATFKNLLLFVQGLSKIQATYSNEDENYYEIFLKKILKSHLNISDIPSMTTKSSISRINNKIIKYSKYYQKWQRQLLLKVDANCENFEDDDLKFYDAYFELLLQKPNEEVVLNFIQNNKESLKSHKFEDINIYLHLYYYCISEFVAKSDLNEAKTLELLNFPVSNKIFEATRLMIQLLVKMESFNNQKIKYSLESIEQETLINNLKNTLKSDKSKKDSNTVFFLEIVLLIIQSILEDNNKDRFEKFFSLIVELETRKVNYILPETLYHKLIKSTITIGLKQEEPLEKLLILQKLVA
ncbi:hypothetical protein QEN19_001741 [Hanseniaspora menglaensis]